MQERGTTHLHEESRVHELVRKQHIVVIRKNGLEARSTSGHIGLVGRSVDPA